MAQPVFYDPRRARWKRLRALFDIAGIVVCTVIIVFIYTALRSEPLPKLLLQFQKHPYHALKETEKEKALERRKQLARRSHRRTNRPPSQVELNTDEGIRAAFYVPWDAASYSSLREYARQIDLLYPEWLHVLSSDGRLQGEDSQTKKKFFEVIQGGVVHPVDDKVMPFLKSEDTGTEVFLLVNFEDLPKKTQPRFVDLLNELSGDLHAKGMKLYVSVPAGNSDFDYRSVASAADGVVMMNYDEHYAGTGGMAGPVASQDWFTDNLT